MVDFLKIISGYQGQTAATNALIAGQAGFDAKVV
jgi:hypothetical protein